MKTLGKFKINPEKVINDEELVNLRGGYETACCECTNEYNEVLGYIVGSTALDCEDDCEAVYGGCADGEWKC